MPGSHNVIQICLTSEIGIPVFALGLPPLSMACFISAEVSGFWNLQHDGDCTTT